MTIERNFIFTNGYAYDINATMGFVQELFDRDESELIPPYRLEAIMSVLSDFKFVVSVSMDDLIPDVWTGVEVHMDSWLLSYGIVDHIVEYYIESLGNDALNVAHYVRDMIANPEIGEFSVSEDDLSTIDEWNIEESIENEDDSVEGVRLLSDSDDDMQI